MGGAPLLTFWSLAAILAAALVGCARTSPPAPIEVHGQKRFERPAVAVSHRLSPQQPTAVVHETQPGTATVQAGDTLYGIARRHNVPIRAVIDANRLEPPYALQPGQRLTLPRVRTHIVQAGDTVHGVARRNNVEVSALVSANGLSPPYGIQVGQALILPGAGAPAPTAVAALEPPAPARPVPMSARSVGPMNPAAIPAAPIHTSPAPATPVVRDVESAPLAPLGMPPAPATKPAEQSAPERISAAPSAPQPVERVAAAPALSMNAPPATSVIEGPAAAAARAPGLALDADDGATEASLGLPARGVRGFHWPLRGRVVSDFGAKGGGLHNDGINIEAPLGTPIRAAEGGVVVYAGNELRGFGNLLLLRHADGWMTAYAHADELLVARGAQVRRGQVIGRVGQTGNVSSPQLHFEIRRGKRAVNPRDHLAAQSAAADG